MRRLEKKIPPMNIKMITTIYYLLYWVFLGLLYYFIPLFGLSMMFVEIYPYFNRVNGSEEEQEENRIINDGDMYPNYPIVKNIRRLSVSPCRKRYRM